MPNRDKTGPVGKGPMTGRGFGPCNPDQKNSVPFGGGRGCGRGRGMGRRFAQGQVDQVQDK